jgi:hypothetical protein
MREIRNDQWRSRYHLSFNEAEDRVCEAARIMDSFGNMAAIASIIRPSDLHNVFYKRYKKRKHVPTGIDEPDYFCFLAYATYIIGQVHRKWPGAERVNFVVSHKKTVTHHIESFRDELQKAILPDLSDLVGDLIAANQEDTIPLQCADVLLWHMQRYYASGRSQRNMNSSDAMRLAGLIQNGVLDGTVHEWELGELEQMSEQLAEAGLIPKRKLR